MLHGLRGRRGPAAAPAQVRPGIEVLLTDSLSLVRNRRIGLVTNQSGIDAKGRRDLDRLLSAGLRVTALFAPEHGLRGSIDVDVAPDTRQERDSATGIPVYLLHDGDTTPPPHGRDARAGGCAPGRPPGRRRTLLHLSGRRCHDHGGRSSWTPAGGGARSAQSDRRCGAGGCSGQRYRLGGRAVPDRHEAWNDNRRAGSPCQRDCWAWGPTFTSYRWTAGAARWPSMRPVCLSSRPA